MGCARQDTWFALGYVTSAAINERPGQPASLPWPMETIMSIVRDDALEWIKACANVLAENRDYLT